MKAKMLILFVLMGMVIIGCSKVDVATSIPQLSFNNVSPNVLFPDETINFALNYTDAAGNVDSIFVEKVTANCSASDFSQIYPLPAFPQNKKSKGEIDVTYSYGVNLQYPAIQFPACQGQNDTCVFRFVLKDNANHASDTVTSPRVIIVNQ